MMQRQLSAAIATVSRGETPDDSDVQRVTRLFHSSVPRSVVTVRRIRRVTNVAAYARFRQLAAAEGGCEAAFYAPSDPAQLSRLQEDGFSVKGFETVPALGRGLPVFVHAGLAFRRARELQKPAADDTYCICLVLCCPGRLGTDSGTQADRLVNPSEYAIVEPTRLHLSYTIHCRFRETSPQHKEQLNSRIREAEQAAVERQRAAKVRWQQYQIACEHLFGEAIGRLQAAWARRSLSIEEAVAPATKIVALEDGCEEARAVIALYQLGGGSIEGAPLQSPRGIGRASPPRVLVQRIENYALFRDYGSAGSAERVYTEAVAGEDSQRSPSPPRGQVDSRTPGQRQIDGSKSPRKAAKSPREHPLFGMVADDSPSRKDRAGRPRFQEHVVWHGTRLKREDGNDGASLEGKVRSIALHGFDPLRCVKGSTALGGIWAATAPLASFGKGLDGRYAFMLCLAKTAYNEWVDTSCVRVLSRERVLPLYVIMHDVT